MLAWAAWQLQYSPTACGTLSKQLTKPSERVAAPPSSIQEVYTVAELIILCQQTVFLDQIDHPVKRTLKMKREEDDEEESRGLAVLGKLFGAA